jgi:hypothetical protein
MAITLPDPTAINRLSAQPNTSIASYRPGQTAAALEHLGSAIANQGNNLQYVMAREQDHLDKLKVQDALNKLEVHQQQATVGESGYKRVMGGDVLTPDYQKNYLSQFDTAVGGISANLTPQQKQLFDAHAKQQRLQFQAGVMQHAMGQTAVYEEQVYKDTIASAQNAAATNWNNPQAVEAALVKANVTLADRLDRIGLKDPVSREVHLKETEGGVHAAVILSAINNDNAGYAKAYFDANKGQMTPQQIKGIESQLKPATDFARGRDIGLEAVKMMQAGKSGVDIEAFLASKADTPGIYQQAQSVLGQFQQAAKADDANAKGTIIEKFSLAGANTSAMNAILNSPEYRALTPEQRGTVAEYMRGQSRATSEFFRVQNDRAQAKKADDPKVFAAFMDTMESPEFTGMTRQQLYALSPTLGAPLVKQLLAEQKSQQSGVAKFQIDADMFNAAVPPSAQGDKERTKAYKGMVESKLQDFLETEKRKPTLEEQKAILRSGSEVYVEAGRFFGTNEREAYALTQGRPSYPQAFAGRAKTIVGNDPAKLADAWGFVTGLQELARIKKMKTIPTEAEALAEYVRSQQGSGMSNQIPR